jgi:hypothetical protein
MKEDNEKKDANQDNLKSTNNENAIQNPEIETRKRKRCNVDGCDTFASKKN